jgi:hypothetical protein
MAKLTNSKFTIKGKSGETHSFEIFDLNTTFNKVGGVYIFTRRYQDADNKFSHEVIYCGITEDLSSRFDNHHKASDIKKKNANCLCVLAANSEKERAMIEKDILGYSDNNFPCNDRLN